MSKPRTKLARAALIANGMVLFGLSLMLFAIAAEQAYAVFTGTWLNILGWAVIVLVAAGLAEAVLDSVRRLTGENVMGARALLREREFGL